MIRMSLPSPLASGDADIKIKAQIGTSTFDAYDHIE